MRNKILNEKQEILLDHLPEILIKNFYLAGGTALSAFYLKHRLSDDLDFFTDLEESMPPVEFFLGLFKGLPRVASVHFEKLFDRRIFSVAFKDKTFLKTEFTVYPFQSLEKRRTVGKCLVDSPLNIITGKILAMTDRYDPKDFVDVYFAMQKFHWPFSELLTKAERRFGLKGLYYLVPERLLLAERIEMNTLPIMLKKIDLEKMKASFIKQAEDIVKKRKKR